ncbi:hypothetical protein [Mesorhizobium sp.]|jgi:hypothetical protein|uniref:hypothetical protein n=1 Tax=Mesorhizobium sp. TaxID=1871066 RepID=UPI0035628B1C
MTAFLRNTLLAAAAVASLAGSALADETIPSCAKTSLNDLWSGRCCDAGASDCRGGGRRHYDNGDPGQNGGEHNGGGDNGGRGNNGGGNNGGTAGKA